MSISAVILIGSPRKGGNTDLLADAFLQGVTEAGGEGEKVYLDDVTIRPIGEVGDTLAERQDIRADDDYLPTLEKTLRAHILVFASPVYWQGVSAQMKAFVDRWSAYYVSPLLLDGMRNKVFAALVPHGAPDPDHHKWVTAPIQVWAAHFDAYYAGHLAVCAQRKGVVAEMPEVREQATALGSKCVELVRTGCPK